jgi:hypothetical protein
MTINVHEVSFEDVKNVLKLDFDYGSETWDIYH